MSSRTPGGTRTPGWIPLLYGMARNQKLQIFFTQYDEVLLSVYGV
jgi:hypothetical protein